MNKDDYLTLFYVCFITLSVGGLFWKLGNDGHIEEMKRIELGHPKCPKCVEVYEK